MSKPFVVNSFGGCGSKLLVKQIAQNLGIINNLNSYHFHSRRIDNQKINSADRVIFIYGDPRDAVLSFFERRYSNHERHGFKNNPGLSEESWAYRHCKNIGGDFEKFCPHMGLQDYLRLGCDYFRLCEFITNWLDAEGLSCPIIFIRYETMWKNLDSIAKLLSLDEIFSSKFPAKVPRRSSHCDLDLHDRSRINQILAPAIKVIDQLDDVFVK